MRCPRCGTETDEQICPTCGYGQLEEDTGSTDLKGKDKILKRVVNSISLLSFFLFVAVLIFQLALLLWSSEWVFTKMLTNQDMIYVVLLIPVPLIEITGYTLGVYFLGLVAAVLVCFIAIFYTGGRGMFSYIKDLVKTRGADTDNLDRPLTRLAFVFMALFFLSLFYYLILEVLGVVQEVPSLEGMSLWNVIYQLTRAAVWEELTVRVVFIGLPMFIYAIWKGERGVRRYLLGGFGFKNRFVLTPLITSSLIFAIAHLGSWDIYKFPPAFFAGLALGYLYIKDGIHSAILLHFVWDFINIPLRFFDSMSMELIFGLLFLIWMITGVYYLHYYLKKGINWLQERSEREKKEKKREVVEPITAGVSAGYVCPNCENSSAVYTEKGRWKCKRCGTESEPTESRSKKVMTKSEMKGQWPPP